MAAKGVGRSRRRSVSGGVSAMPQRREAMRLWAGAPGRRSSLRRRVRQAWQSASRSPRRHPHRHPHPHPHPHPRRRVLRHGRWTQCQRPDLPRRCLLPGSDPKSRRPRSVRDSSGKRGAVRATNSGAGAASSGARAPRRASPRPSMPGHRRYRLRQPPPRRRCRQARAGGSTHRQPVRSVHRRRHPRRPARQARQSGLIACQRRLQVAERRVLSDRSRQLSGRSAAPRREDPKNAPCHPLRQHRPRRRRRYLRGFPSGPP